MDAVKFIEERNRMCEFYHNIEKGYCTGECPAYDIQCDDLEYLSANAKELVSLVEEWSDKHPRKTRQTVFLEQYPESEIDSRGDLMVCPKRISADCRDRYGNCTNRLCSDCRREFWMKEVE